MNSVDLRAACEAYLDSQRWCTLWSRTFNIADEDAGTALEWLVDVVEQVLAQPGR